MPYAKRQFPCVSGILVGTEFDYASQRKESLYEISAKFGVDSQVIAAMNHLRRDAYVKPGQAIHIDNRHVPPCDITHGILVNPPQRMLFFYRDGKLETSYPIAVGRPTWRTPLGGFAVLRLEKNPVWVVPESIQEEMELEGLIVKERVPPGPDNPLGDYWIGLSLTNIGIHGTNAPVSIYSYRTHGCIRLHPDNAKDLFGRVSEGEPGMVVYEPVLFAKLDDGRIFLEADRDIYRKSLNVFEDAKAIAGSTGLTNLIDWSLAADVVKNHDGIAHDVTAKK